jgi:hypothetical protein
MAGALDAYFELATLGLWIHVSVLFCTDLCFCVFYSDNSQKDGIFHCGCVFDCAFSPFFFSMNVEELENKLMTQKCAPPYLFSAIWTIAIVYMADKTKLRMPYMVLDSVITLVGLLLTAYVKVRTTFLAV